MLKALYLHTPFCKSKCSYCVYDSVQDSEKNINDYFNIKLPEVLRSECFRKITEENNFEELYCGGGTPTIGSADQWRNILSLLPLHKINMLCMECSPSTVTPQHISLWREYKFKWISMGVQSFNEDVLKINNRSYTKKENIEKIATDIMSNNNILNIDLICGLGTDPSKHIDLFLEDFYFTMSQIQPDSITIHVNSKMSSVLLDRTYRALLDYLKGIEGYNDYICVNHDLIYLNVDTTLNSEFRFMRRNTDFIFRQMAAAPTKLVKNWLTWKLCEDGVVLQSPEKESIHEIYVRDTSYRLFKTYRSKKNLKVF